MAEAKLKNPSVLAFEGKLIPSDALMYAGGWDSDAWQPIAVTEKAVRGTISNRQKASISNDPAKLDAEVSKANLQTVDTAALPQDCDTLMLRFSLRIIAGLSQPTACNDTAYQAALTHIIQSYEQDVGFAELASRYAQNIASARFMWRNRVGAEALRVEVETDGETLQFQAHEFSLREFTAAPALETLAAVIERGLSGQGYALLKVRAYSKLGPGQPIYPSQELVMGGGKGDKSKHLYQLGGQAAMHSQKIGNALRTIDTWHKAVDEVGPIAVEPFGSVTSRGAAYRQPKEKTDFYNILDAWMLKGKTPALEEQHYVMAMLIRGGVFGGE